jgi:hypothetical protein
MSIYCTDWEIQVKIFVPDPAGPWEAFSHAHPRGAPGVPCRERWFEVYCQVVPACIGPHRGEGYYSGPGFEWLPPPVPWGEAADNGEPGARQTPRAAFVVDALRAEKEGQRYLDPLVVMTGEEYERTTMPEMVHLIERALAERYGVRAAFVGRTARRPGEVR